MRRPNNEIFPKAHTKESIWNRKDTFFFPSRSLPFFSIRYEKSTPIETIEVSKFSVRHLKKSVKMTNLTKFGLMITNQFKILNLRVSSCKAASLG